MGGGGGIPKGEVQGQVIRMEGADNNMVEAVARKVIVEVELPEGVGEEEARRLITPIIRDLLDMLKWEKLAGEGEVGEEKILELARNINRAAWERIKEEI